MNVIALLESNSFFCNVVVKQFETIPWGLLLWYRKRNILEKTIELLPRKRNGIHVKIVVEYAGNRIKHKVIQLASNSITARLSMASGKQLFPRYTVKKNREMNLMG